MLEILLALVVFFFWGGILLGVLPATLAAVRALHDRNAQAFAPHAQLRARRRAERVPGGEHDALALPDVIVAQLGNGGGFPDAVHADHHDHVTPGRDLAAAHLGRKAQFAEFGAPGVGFQLQGQGVHQGFLKLLAGAAAHVFQDFLGGRPAHVGGDQGVFQILDGVEAVREDVTHVRAQRTGGGVDLLTGLAQAVAQAF